VSAEIMHNAWPALWAKCNYEALQETGKLGEILFFMRAGYTGSPPNESLSNDELIRENYQGIRPAPGYPACPEHTEKGTIWQLLDV
ncbi:hypothetical protein MJL33_30970, partial [Salmonella enterica subsp. enterica serovar Kentucky]|nr:hypothetical protein [Salmonella enterica subsp. enterica serovar Kentucky]